MNVAEYQAKVYPDPPCWALVADVYAHELGTGVEDYKTINSSVREIARAFRLALYKSPHGFSPLATPVNFAIVLMGKSPRFGIHHAGIFYGGQVLHATPEGVYYQDMVTLADSYALIEFWGRP